MKRSIVIPTWKGHFWANLRFLKSCHSKVKTKTSVDIHFIVSDSHEKEELHKLLTEKKLLCRFNIAIKSIKEILRNHGAEKEFAETFSVSLFENKFSYQSIKKIYSALDSQADQVLVVDSEAKILKKLTFESLFENYFEKPKIFFSKTSNPELKRINQASLSILQLDPNANPNVDFWIFEYPAWFFEREILLDFFSEVEKINKDKLFNVFLKKNNVFESICYQAFIFTKIKKYYRYEINSIEQVTKKFLGESLAVDFLSKFTGIDHGIFERFLLGLTSSNFERLQNLCEALRFVFFRVEANYGGGDKNLVRRFVNSSKYLRIAACSEGEVFNLQFGIKQAIKTLLNRFQF